MDALAALPLQGAAAGPRPTADRQKALSTARDFEAVFIADAFKIMMEGVASDPINGASGSESWRELLVDEYAKDMVHRGGIGLAAPIADELIRIQEAASP